MAVVVGGCVVVGSSCLQRGWRFLGGKVMKILHVARIYIVYMFRNSCKEDGGSTLFVLSRFSV